MTRVHFTVVGYPGQQEPISLEELIVQLDAVPRVGETVRSRGGVPLRVRTVVHYPWGTDDMPTQFVYVVLGD